MIPTTATISSSISSSTIQIYFPNDLIKPIIRNNKKANGWYLLGFKRGESIFVVVQIVEDVQKFTTEKPQEVLKDLQLLGVINKESSNEEKIPTAGLELTLTKSFPYPKIKRINNKEYTFILFHPPNYKNLEYLSFNPIYLQSTEMEQAKAGNSEIVQKYNQLDGSQFHSKKEPFDNEILDKINQCSQIRIVYKRWYLTGNQDSSIWSVSKIPRSMLFKPLAIIIAIIQTLTIWIIWILNFEFGKKKFKLTNISAVMRQLDLRLKQINYFPIQFLCYYDRSILYNEFEREDTINEISLALNLPIFNSNLNINNSNYINFHNSLWLIINDVLLGISVHKLINSHYEIIATFVNETLIRKLLFDDLFGLISWVSYRHPAGFKLNTELGLFVGDLFLWALQFWRLLLVDVLTICPESKQSSISFKVIIPMVINTFHTVFPVAEYVSTLIFKYYLTILCYMGFSFLVSFMIDYMQIISFHIYCFYFTSAKIYHRQVQILKSLFQLFCGKKYNILRNRIDNLDNYSDLGVSFEVDQLLLGILIFVILVALLPTIFAFYLMFFLTRILCLCLIYVGENVLVVINFFPLFVMLLKLKNSNRLQGGLSFNVLDVLQEKTVTTYLQLKNKSLTYLEIFKNFGKLFRNSRAFTLSLIPNFINGEPISLEQKHELKFSYLMLPRNYDQTIFVWTHFTKRKDV